MPKNFERFTGIFGGQTPKAIIDEANKLVPPTAEELFDAELHGTPTDIDPPNKPREYREILNDTLQGDAGYLSPEVAEVQFPDEMNAARQEEFRQLSENLDWDIKTHQDLRSQFPDKTKNLPSDLDLFLDRIDSLKKYDLAIPEEFTYNEESKKYYRNLVDQWKDREFPRFAKGFSDDPRYMSWKYDKDLAGKRLQNFINEGMPQKPKLTPANINQDIRAKSLQQALGDTILSDVDKETVKRIKEESLRLFEKLGGTSDEFYNDPHIFYKQQTPQQQLRSVQEDLKQQQFRLDNPDLVSTTPRPGQRTVTTPDIKPPTTPDVTPPRGLGRKVPPGLGKKVPPGLGKKVVKTGVLGDVLISGLFEYATNPEVNPLEALYFGATSFIPESGGTAPGTMPITVDGKDYAPTSTPGKYQSIDRNSQAYGIEYLNGKPQIVPWGQGKAGFPKPDAPLDDLGYQIKKTIKTRLGVPEPKGRQLILAVLNNQEGEMIPGDPTSFRLAYWTPEDRTRFYRR